MTNGNHVEGGGAKESQAAERPKGAPAKASTKREAKTVNAGDSGKKTK